MDGDSREAYKKEKSLGMKDEVGCRVLRRTVRNRRRKSAVNWWEVRKLSLVFLALSFCFSLFPAAVSGAGDCHGGCVQKHYMGCGPHFSFARDLVTTWHEATDDWVARTVVSGYRCCKVVEFNQRIADEKTNLFTNLNLSIYIFFF